MAKGCDGLRSIRWRKLVHLRDHGRRNNGTWQIEEVNCMKAIMGRSLGLAASERHEKSLTFR